MHVDFVLADASTPAPVLVIELDDRSHDRAEAKERDAFTTLVRTVTVILEGLEPQWIKEVQIDAVTPVQSYERGISRSIGPNAGMGMSLSSMMLTYGLTPGP
jgi:Protein of unknown function (DUF2726)